MIFPGSLVLESWCHKRGRETERKRAGERDESLWNSKSTPSQHFLSHFQTIFVSHRDVMCKASEEACKLKALVCSDSSSLTLSQISLIRTFWQIVNHNVMWMSCTCTRQTNRGQERLWAAGCTSRSGDETLCGKCSRSSACLFLL